MKHKQYLRSMLTSMYWEVFNDGAEWYTHRETVTISDPKIVAQRKETIGRVLDKLMKRFDLEE